MRKQRVNQGAFLIEHPMGTFIGIVATYDTTLKVAAQRLWGNCPTREITAEELLEFTRRGISVFTGTVD